MHLLGLFQFHSCLSSHDRKARQFLPSSLDPQYRIFIQYDERTEKSYSNIDIARIPTQFP